MIFKQIGVGLAAAILIDATIVRAVLLPATMKLLGDWNWYLPKWLEWLPHLEHGEPARSRAGRARLLPVAQAPRRPHCRAIAQPSADIANGPPRPGSRRPSHRGRPGAGRARRRRAARRRRQLPAAEARHLGRRPPRQRPRAARRCSSAPALVYPRLRAGARAAIALLAGFFGVLAGTEAVHYTREVGPSGDDYTGLLSIPAGLAADRPRRRHAVEVSADGRPALVAVHAPAAPHRGDAVRRSRRRRPPGHDRVRRHACGARRGSARRSRRRLRGRGVHDERRAAAARAGTSRRGTARR